MGLAFVRASPDSAKISPGAGCNREATDPIAWSSMGIDLGTGTGQGFLGRTAEVDSAFAGCRWSYHFAGPFQSLLIGSPYTGEYCFRCDGQGVVAAMFDVRDHLHRRFCHIFSDFPHANPWLVISRRGGVVVVVVHIAAGARWKAWLPSPSLNRWHPSSRP